MNEKNLPIEIVGINMITTNEAAQTQNTIGKLWETFLKSSIQEKLGDKVLSPTVFAVYSDYENGYKGNYRITLGYAVNDTANLPAGLSTITLLPGNYKTFKSKSLAVEDAIEAWKTVWGMDPDLYPRSFATDFEEHTGSEIIIHIGYK